MVKVRFGMKFNPRNMKGKTKLLLSDFADEGDAIVRKIQESMVRHMKDSAPGPGQPGPFVTVGSGKLSSRSGKLKHLIRAAPVKSRNAGAGSVDKRVNLLVESRAAHTRFVIKGVSSRFGLGASGKGRFFPNIRKRIRYGWYPGFKGYDFIEVAKMKVIKDLGDLVDGRLNTFKKRARSRLS